MANPQNIDIAIKAKNEASAQLNAVAGDVAKVSGAGDDFAASGLAIAGAVTAVVAGIVKVSEAVFALGEAGAQVDRLRTGFDNLARGAGTSGDALLSAMRKASQGTVADTELIGSANRAMLLGVAANADQMAKLLEVAGARGKAMGLSTSQAFSDIVTGIGRMSAPILDNLGIVIDSNKAYADYASQLGKTADQLDNAQKKAALLNAVVASSQTLINDNAAAGDDLASSFERMDSSIQNAKDALGQLFAPAAAAVAQGIAAAAQAAANATVETGKKMSAGEALGDIGTIHNAINQLNVDIERNKATLASLTPGTQQYNDELLAMYGNISELRNRQADLTTAQSNYYAALNALYPAQAQTADEMNRTSIVAEGLAKTQAVVNDNMLRGAYATDAMRASVVTLAGSLPGLTQEFMNLQNVAAGSLNSIAVGLVQFQGEAGALSWLKDQNGALKEQIKGWQDAGYTIDQVQGVLMPAYLNDLRQSNDLAHQQKVATSEWNKELKAVQKEYDALQGKVEGVLSSALSLSDIGVDASKILVDPKETDPNKQKTLLPRQDAINEDARRLADVAVKGFASPWAEYLQGKFPDLFKGALDGENIRVMAAQALQDFQDGLHPELLNKDAAKERVRRMILGEQSLAALAKEITAELNAEMGKAAPENLGSLAEQALGLSSAKTGATVKVGSVFDPKATQQAGLDAASTITGALLSGVKNSDAGVTIVNTLVEQMRGVYERIRKAGEDAGTQWGNAFMGVVGDNVPSGLLNMLASLVTPLVLTGIQKQQALTGAK